MKTSDFDYDLPEYLIAQTPLEDRTASRMLRLERTAGKVEHDYFCNLGNFLKKGDLLLLNDSRVLPARLYGRRKDSGAVIELLLLEASDLGIRWETLVKPGRKALPNTELLFSDKLSGRITEVLENGNRIIEFDSNGNVYDNLYEIGEMPLPHYIHHKLEDRERYQTVYADKLGSAAAPTAGLHFTKDFLQKLIGLGINVGKVTLHVGLGTFRPVKAENIEDHHMHSEHYEIPPETIEQINRAKENGGRIISVGTTTLRTLETLANLQNYPYKPASGYTDIFITPGYEFKLADGLLTNFHLPKSTLIMLVSAFAGRDSTLNAYNQAVKNEYRFYSFGDSMLII